MLRTPAQTKTGGIPRSKEDGIKILAVIPARKGSKRIKRKNLRLMHEKPLIGYILDVATSSQLIDDIIVSTDDSDIAEYVAADRKIRIRARPKELAGDEITLDPVIYDAVTYMEAETGNAYDIVVTLQPTSPTLKFQTLDQVLLKFIGSHYDTCISVVEDKHLSWRVENKSPIPQYEKRLNRQWLPKSYKETGSFVLSRRRVVAPTSRFGECITLYPVSQEEAIDIDDEVDWLFAETLLSRLQIAFVVNGNRQVGMGHIYRALTLADAFFGNRMRFFSVESNERAIRLVRGRGYEIEVPASKEAALDSLSRWCPDLVVNDILDTDGEYISQLCSRGYFVVNFEDLGEGNHQANLVFNALYEFSAPPEHHRFGAKYVCLSQNFLLASPAPFNSRASTLLITFGGADENNLTLRACKIVPKLLKDTSLERVLVVLGPSYDYHEELAVFLKDLSPAVRAKIHTYETVTNMAKLIREADIAVTSNGRTVYELASMGVPGICIAQNDRETLHLFSRYSKGLHYLGIASNVRDEKLSETIRTIATDQKLRQKMVEALLAADLRTGITRVKQEILDQYWRWKYENSNNR